MKRIDYPDVMTVRQAAKYLGVSVGFLNRSRMSKNLGSGPDFIKLSNRLVRYLKTTLDEYLRRMQVGGDASPQSPKKPPFDRDDDGTPGAPAV